MKITKTTGQGWVLGVTVPAGIVRVRRNGKECWTGNSGRETGGYTADEQPSRGSEGQAKRAGSLEVAALLGHNAVENLKDISVVRGTKNEDYWTKMKLGLPLPEPGVPFIYNKFINLLKAGGVNVVRKGDMQVLGGLTDADIDKMASGEVRNSDTVNAATLAPKTGGLFDEGVFGGTIGTKWGKITLNEPIPNPVFEDPVRKLLGLTDAQYRGVLSGKEQLDGKTGGQAIYDALAAINVPEKINYYRNEAMNARGQRRDNAVKNLRYLSNVDKSGTKLTDWMLTKVPVIPPIFRPISKMGDTLMVADMNDLYRDVIEMNQHIGEARKVLPESELAEEKLHLYDAVTGVFGWGDAATQEGKSKRLKGAIRQVLGDRPKTGLAQSKLFSKAVDLVARGVIVPDPELDMDSIGLPEDMAWKLYKPFVMRTMVRHGFPPVKARELIDAKAKEAKDVLVAEMGDRPVLLNRAPSWHKFNILAFYPRLVEESDTLHVSPLVTSGFTADFDGDQANFHVPAGDKAVHEAKTKMLPSKNLFKVDDLRTPMHVPSKEMLMGLYEMTKSPEKGAPVVFKNTREAQEAYHHGLIKLNTPIIIRG